MSRLLGSAVRPAGPRTPLPQHGLQWQLSRDREDAVLVGLLLLAGSGDRPAFGAFYDRTASSVFGFVRSQLRVADEAEPATLNAYLRMWRAAPRFTPDGEGAMQWALMQACAEVPRWPKSGGG